MQDQDPDRFNDISLVHEEAASLSPIDREKNYSNSDRTHVTFTAVRHRRAAQQVSNYLAFTPCLAIFPY
jgi:hypothetical protein